ncbi:MAG: restriction endonuclease [Conexibacter sp.]
MPIDMQPGETRRRAELHQQYGGRRQGGISPSKVSNNVFVFTDQTAAVLHGYIYDGWREDGFYHYTGEGQVGDQKMVQGNRTVRDHAAEGRDLHVFDVHGREVTYMGPFEYVDYYTADAPQNGDDEIRSVIVFRLRPLGRVRASQARSRVEMLGKDSMKEVPVEQHLTESFVIAGSREPREAERREQKLVREYLAYLTSSGDDVCRLQLWPEDEPAPLFCDMYDKTTNTLIEAKGSVARPAIRMALGQLADYARLVDPTPSKVILVPQKPRPDLMRLAASEGVEIIWRNGDAFDGTASQA